MKDYYTTQIPSESHQNNGDSVIKSSTNHHTLTLVKEKIHDAVLVAADKLNIKPENRNPEAHHQDGQTGPE
ncbi:hypothetical protein G9A89_009168 [Geosiphon pyriformis]|nr:hypothetical protein G9A89_009168 [Geosiphon pyriformis]